MYDSKELYSSGYYLHRLYLVENPLLKQSSVTGKTGRVKTLLNKQVDILKQTEDEALINISRAFMGSDNASIENGMKFLQDFVTGDGRALLNRIIEAFIDTPHDAETNKYIFSDAEQDRIIKATINALENRFGNSQQEFDKNVNSWQDKLNASLSEISFYKDRAHKEYRAAAALEGDFFERIIPTYFNLLFEETLRDKNNQLRDWVDLEAEFTGQKDVENAVLALDKKQPFDVNIKMSFGDVVKHLPIQVKAKPISTSEEIRLYTHMNIVNLISQSLTTGQQDALRTAIINQHYWSQGSYRNFVEEAAKRNNHETKIDGRGHPTAIERLDVNTTLGPMKPVVPLMRYAIMYNLITGINNVTDQLFYIIVGKGKTSAVLRSSEIIQGIVNDMMELNISGHGVGKVQKEESKITVPEFIDSSVYSDYKTYKDRPEWYLKTAPKMQKMFNKIAITATLKYGVKK